MEGKACFLTTLEPCLVQARVSGGFPVQPQVKAASIPVSTVMGLGSDRSLGPTVEERRSQTDAPRVHNTFRHLPTLSDGPWGLELHLHCTSTRVLTFVLPTELDTSQETGSVK